MTQNHLQFHLRRVTLEPESKLDVFVQSVFHNNFNTRRWLRKNGTVLAVSLLIHLFILFCISFLPGRIAPPLTEVVMIVDYAVSDTHGQLEKADIASLAFVPQIETNSLSHDSIGLEARDESKMAHEILDEDLRPDALQNPVWSSGLDANLKDMPGFICINGVSGDATARGVPSIIQAHRRGKHKLNALQKFGGNFKTDSAVSSALDWLARHQEYDGSWGVAKWSGADDSTDNKLATTACALLPFLNAGYSENHGVHKKMVRNGVRYINNVIAGRVASLGQDKLAFNNNVVTAMILMALSETSLHGSSPSTTRNAKLLAEMLVNQQAQYAKGWSEQGGGEDLTVTGWVLLGLLSTQGAHSPSSNEGNLSIALNDIKAWLKDDATVAAKGMARFKPGDEGEACNLTWLGMFQKLHLGFPNSDTFLEKAAENSLKLGWIEQAFEGSSIKDSAGIYYGTLAAFQMQGELWSKWNDKMKSFLLMTQIQGSADDLGGSWSPGTGALDKVGGRVMSTALMAMCLEVYYQQRLVN